MCDKSILIKRFAYAIMPIGKKKSQVHEDKETNPRTVVAYSPGILLYFYSGKAPTRLFVVLAVAVKPLDDVVAGYTSRNSD